MATRVRPVATMAPLMRAIPRPWKMGSLTMTTPPMTTARAVRMMGRERMRPEATTASLSECPRSKPSSTKSTKRMEFRTMIPASAIMPIMEVAVKNAPLRAWAGRIPMRVRGMGAMITRGAVKDWNQATTRT